MEYRILYCNHGVLVTWCPKSEWRYGGRWWLDLDVGADVVWACVLGLEVSIGRKRCADVS